MKFVWLDLEDGSRVPVNPDRVAYLRRTLQGKTHVVFGSFAGGIDGLVVAGTGEEVAAQLEGAGEQWEAPPMTQAEIDLKVDGYREHIWRTALAAADPDPFTEKKKGPPAKATPKRARRRR